MDETKGHEISLREKLILNPSLKRQLYFNKQEDLTDALTQARINYNACKDMYELTIKLADEIETKYPQMGNELRKVTNCMTENLYKLWGTYAKYLDDAKANFLKFERD